MSAIHRTSDGALLHGGPGFVGPETREGGGERDKGGRQGVFGIIETQRGGGGAPPTPQTPPATGTIVGKNETINKANEAKSFLGHKLLGPDPTPPLQTRPLGGGGEAGIYYSTPPLPGCLTCRLGTSVRPVRRDQMELGSDTGRSWFLLSPGCERSRYY